MAAFGNILMPFGKNKLLLNLFKNATVAFSLRKLRNTYSGSVIRVRRSSDNTELDFKANEINNGAMLSWVNTFVDKFQSNFIPDSNQFTMNQFIGTSGQSIGGQNNALKLELIGGNVNHWTGNSFPFEVGKNFTITFDVYIPSTNVAVNTIQLNRPLGALNFTPILDTWQTFSTSGTTLFSTIRFFAVSNGNIVINADGDVMYLKNITLTQTTADGLISVWYDQSGNQTNAFQTTAVNQPRIVLNGVVEIQQGKPAINFNFDNSFTRVVFSQEFSTPLSSYLVLRETFVNAFPYIYGASTGQFTDYMILGFNGNVVRSFLTGANQSDDINKSDYSLYTVISDTSNSLLKRNNNVIATTNNTFGTSQRTIVSIGAIGGGTQLTTRLSGTIQEIITYPQNQTPVNSQIEANINNYYTIY